MDFCARVPQRLATGLHDLVKYASYSEPDSRAPSELVTPNGLIKMKIKL